jgi:hypothetical protein
MTKLLITTVAITLMATSANAKTILGCEVVKADNGNYFYKVDNACQFDRTGLGERGDGKFLLE